MKHYIGGPVALCALLLLFSVQANPLIEPYLNELLVQSGRWFLEVRGAHTEKLDGWSLSSRSGSALFKSGIQLTPTSYLVVTPDSLQSPLTIDPQEDSVGVRDSGGRSRMYVAFGPSGSSSKAHPSWHVQTPPPGCSICFRQAFFYLDSSPTLGAPNDTAGAWGTISGVVVDSVTGERVADARVYDGDDEYRFVCASDDSGRFAGRYYAHPIRLCAIVSANGWTTGFGYLDLTLTPGQTVDTVVKVKRTTSIGPEQADQGFALFQNYPNPFNPSTTISYTLPAACNVTMTVYDGLGREVIELVRGYRPPGAYRATWNGRDQFGDLVGSGIYLARLVAAERGKGLTVSKTLKLLLLH